MIVPTFNEIGNIEALLDKLSASMGEIPWNIIFVDDDSPDGTAVKVKQIALAQPNVTCIRRLNRRGLAGAVIEGVMASSAPFIAVMDGDLQHDEKLLPVMLDVLTSGGADLVVASRFLSSNDPIGLSPMRRGGSKLANALTNRALGTKLSDPLSGFFMTRRDLFDCVADRLSVNGFKILLDFVGASKSSLRIAELPFEFAFRQSGDSKLDLKVAIDFCGLLLSRLTRNVVPTRFFLFALVGVSGLLIHLTVLRVLLASGFAMANLVAGFSAMTSNYAINNALTYRDRRKKGVAWLWGYLRFGGVCATGLVVNMAVGMIAYRWGLPWWLAGASGALMGGVWNYAMASRVVW
ncbi:glycosyltransferase family 2 protein [uncultured Maricaulis sp.]|uniref:glycosyltransferase family 2 protein n=1 Tax=uncultured Maricaulis sp. TaxID=174710 RepID=UPI0030DC43B8